MQTRLAAKRIELQLKAHTNNELVELPNDTTVEPSSGSKVPPPPESEAAVVPKKRRRRKPVELCRLNLDVLFLIAVYIHPVDLLNLARTCKSLRELLMGKASVFVWKTARRQIKGLPDCPADLTEPEYANLVFCARCHCCGKYTTNIFWNIRRRYCNKCIGRRLRRHSSCQDVIRINNVLAAELVTIKREYCAWLDREQVASFMSEYRQCSDKNQFISDKQENYKAICHHAKQCEAWHKVLKRKKASKRKDELQELRWERKDRIFERLVQHGYKPEIQYFDSYRIQRSRDTDFRTSKPLTDKEWNRILPEWLEIMSNFRLERLERTVYAPRRRKLFTEYNGYLEHPSPGAPTFDLLPHVADLARFPPFREIIKAPEGTQIDDKLFASAFAQLPVLVVEWRKKVDAELAEMVKIPSRLLSEDAPGRRVLASNRTRRTEPQITDSDKLQLACAMFHTDHAGVFTYLEVFSVSTLHYAYQMGCNDWERSGSISDQFDIRFLEEAPYIVHACGLNPSVAKVDDMDRRNARLRCLCCRHSLNIVMDWRNAMLHARSCHESSRELAPLSKASRWKLVGDEHIDAIQTIEQSIEKKLFPGSVRCLLCRPHVGDELRNVIEAHIECRHDTHVKSDDIKQGVHYAPLGICDSQSTVVEMVEEGEQVTFRLR